MQVKFEEKVMSMSRGVFAISVVSEMVSMPAQNLRVYERHGLLEPERTAGGTRRYSEQDVERLHRIRDLLAEGLNLAGVARVLRLEAEMEQLREERDRLRAECERWRGR
jgi:DNA-binding transcriptional MerR regulator